MTALEYLTILTTKAGNKPLDANTINVLNNEIIADRLYASKVGARTVPKENGMVIQKGDLIKIVSPLIPDLVDTSVIIGKQLASQNQTYTKETVFVAEFQIDVDKSLTFQVIDSVEVAGFGGMNKYTLLKQSVYLLKWADFFNQEFIKVLVQTVIANKATQYTKLADNATKEDFVDAVLDEVAEIKAIYSNMGLSVPDESIVIYHNTKASHILTQFLKINTGNDNGAPRTGTATQLSELVNYTLVKDDRVMKGMGDSSATGIYSPKKPLAIVDIKGGIVQESRIITTVRFKDGDAEGTFTPTGRAILGTHRVSPAEYVRAIGVTDSAKLNASNFDSNKLTNEVKPASPAPAPDAVTFDGAPAPDELVLQSESGMVKVRVTEEQLELIKQKLNLSPKTHISNVSKKLRVKNITNETELQAFLA